MSDDVFRIIVTVAVLVAGLAFVVQACIMFALYRVTRKAQENTDRLLTRAEPLIAKAEPTLGRVGDLIDRAGPVIAGIGPVLAKTGAMIDKAGPVLESAVPAIEKVGPALAEAREIIARTAELLESTNRLATTANLVVEDVRPDVATLSREASEITRMGREQVERIGSLLDDAGDRARARIERIDHGVEATIEQVEQVSGAMKRAMMKPVREVNGVAAGISAVVSTLVRGHRKSSVDSATQDEEMFI